MELTVYVEENSYEQLLINFTNEKLVSILVKQSPVPS